MAAPVYIQRLNTQGLGVATVLPQVANEQANGAIARFGAALSGVAQVAQERYAVFEQTNRATTLADRTTGFLTGLDQLEQEFRNDPDPTTSPQRFAERAEKLKADATTGLRPEDQSELNLKLTRMGLSSVGSVRQQSLSRQADQYAANMDTQYDAFQKRYVAAGSDAERQAVSTEWNNTLQQGVARGVMTVQRATAYQQSLNKSGDEALMLRAIATSPQRALAALDDQAQFAGFDPATRERYRAQAQAAQDELQKQNAVNVARTDPARAIAMVGRVTSAEQAASVFDRAIIPQESGGRPGVVSNKGALGIAQVMPDTARMVARQHGIPGIAGLDDGELRSLMLSDPALNRRLGLLYFEGARQAFDGNLAPMIAGYHAGYGKARDGSDGAVLAAHKRATAEFGPGYTPEQFIQSLPAGLNDGAKATRDYVRDIFRRLGTDTTAPGFSQRGSFSATSAVTSELQTQAATIARQENQMISLAMVGASETIQNFNQGYARDPGLVAQQRAMLNLGAMRGDGSAMQKLRELDEAEAAAPIIREAYQTRPDQLAAGISQIRQQMAASPDVSPALMRRLRLFEGVQKEVMAARNDDPVSLGVRAGIVPATSLPGPSQAADPSFTDAFARRSVAAERSNAVYGGEMKFFTAAERPAFKAAYEAANDEGKVDMLKALARGASPAVYEAAVSEIAGASPVMQLVGRMARTDEKTARDILRGTALMADKGYAGPKAEELKAAFKDKIGGDLFPGESQGAVIDAALAIYAAERGRNWQLYDATDRSGLTKAIERAAGGQIVSINRAQTVLPRGMSEGVFRGAIGMIKPEMLGGSATTADFVRQYGQFVRLDPDRGIYGITVKQGSQTRVVSDAMGIPVQIDIEKMAQDPALVFGQVRGLNARERNRRDVENAYRVQKGLPVNEPGERLR